MSAVLPRSVTYVQRRQQYVPCSARIKHPGKITETMEARGETRGYGRFGTSTGHIFCALCWRRKLIIELAMRLKISKDELKCWIDLAVHGSNEDVARRLEEFQEEMERLGVSEELL